MRFLLPLALLTGATGAPAPAPATERQVSAWEIGPVVRGRNYSVGMPARPRGGPGGTVEFDFPLAGRGEVDAMTRPIGSLVQARKITMRYRIEAAPGTRFHPAETPDEPATISLYFQRSGDSWSGRGPFASYRWYVPGRAVATIAPGEHQITIAFDEVWTNVLGQPNSQWPDAYAAARREAARIGIAFGSAGRRSHGVYATGPARFTLLALTVE